MVIEHRLIHPSSNRNAAFTRRTGSTQPRSRNEPPSIRYSYCAEKTHCSTAFVSRGCTGKGALASALLVERKSRGINVLYRCGYNAYGRCLSLKQNSGETEQCIVRLLRFPLPEKAIELARSTTLIRARIVESRNKVAPDNSLPVVSLTTFLLSRYCLARTRLENSKILVVEMLVGDLSNDHFRVTWWWLTKDHKIISR